MYLLPKIELCNFEPCRYKLFDTLFCPCQRAGKANHSTLRIESTLFPLQLLDVDEGKIGNTKCQNIIIICEENKADCSREQLTYDEGEEEKSKEIVRRHFVQSELYDK